jgi:hypothetical protein
MSFASPSPEVVKELKKWDDYSVQVLAKESQRLFGTVLSKEDVRTRYQPTLRTYEKTGAVSWRMKMNLSGRNAVKCWDHFRQQRALPESWTSCSVVPRVRISGWWIMGKELGTLMTLDQALIDEASADCPF